MLCDSMDGPRMQGNTTDPIQTAVPVEVDYPRAGRGNPDTRQGTGEDTQWAEGRGQDLKPPSGHAYVQTGEGMLKVAKALGVGSGTVQRIKAEP
jgi:hypothetical protein